jgi:hypothetical protein
METIKEAKWLSCARSWDDRPKTIDMVDLHESEWAGHFQRLKQNIGGKVYTKVLFDMWKLGTNANNTLEFSIEMRFIRLSH